MDPEKEGTSLRRIEYLEIEDACGDEDAYGRHVGFNDFDGDDDYEDRTYVSAEQAYMEKLVYVAARFTLFVCFAVAISSTVAITWSASQKFRSDLRSSNATIHSLMNSSGFGQRLLL
jgi:hypothetical protein